MFLSEWREFPSAPCLAGKKNLENSRLHVVEIARASVTASELLSFLVRLRTYQHLGMFCGRKADINNVQLRFCIFLMMAEIRSTHMNSVYTNILV